MHKVRQSKTFQSVFGVVWLPAIALIVAFIASCDKGKDTVLPDSPKPQPTTQAIPGPPSSIEPVPSEDLHETLAVEPKLRKVSQRIRLDTLAWLGQEWRWPVHASGRKDWIPVRVSGSESMRFQDGALTYRPIAESSEEFQWNLLSPKEAASQTNGAKTGLPLRFKLHALKPVRLEWAPFTDTALVGRPVSISLMARKDSRFPGEVRISVQVSGSSQSESTWVVQSPATVLQRSFSKPGLQKIKAVAWNESTPVDSTVLEIQVLATVSVPFLAPKDTLEPGTTFHFQIGKPEGNGPFQLELDAEQDGKADWSGSREGKIPWKANRSGRYVARLKVTDSKGLTGWSEAAWIVNQKIQVKASAKSMKCNLVTPFQLKLEFQDSDDSLQSWFAVLPGTNANGKPSQDTIALRASEGFTRNRGKGYAERGWTVPGLYPALLCALSGDGRQACGKISLEVFNAKPTCKIKGDIKPVPGTPVSLQGQAEDPDGSLVKFEWDLDGDGRYEWQRGTNETVPFTFSRKGKFPIAFKVTTADQMTARDSVLMVVKNSW